MKIIFLGENELRTKFLIVVPQKIFFLRSGVCDNHGEFDHFELLQHNHCVSSYFHDEIVQYSSTVARMWQFMEHGQLSTGLYEKFFAYRC